MHFRASSHSLYQPERDGGEAGLQIDGRNEADAAAAEAVARFRGVRCVAPLGLALGEGALWLDTDALGGPAFWCVDILGRRIWRFDPATTTALSWAAPAMPGFIAPLPDGRFVAGLADGLHRFDPRDGSFAFLCEVEPDRPGNRVNDGYVDHDGKLWFGTMNMAETEPSGALYAVSGLPGDAPGLRRVDDGYVVTNGPTVSPCGRVLYHADSAHQLIYAFDRAADGTLGGRRVFVRLEHGHPDGLAVDVEGHVWAGIWGGGRVLRFAPDGSLSGAMAIAARNVTKLALGGPDRRTAYVSTARKGFDPARPGDQPLAGGIFAFEVEVAGLPQNILRDPPS